MIRAGKQGPGTTAPLLEPHPNDPGGSMPAVQGWTAPCTGKKNGLFSLPFRFVCKKDHFTKTGSGQTQRNSENETCLFSL
jgi:hypothetical protein